jgi:hypothetical protein
MNCFCLKASTSRITISLCVSLCAWRYGIAQNANPSPARSLENARVDAVDTDRGSIVLTDCPTDEQSQVRSSRCSGQR